MPNNLAILSSRLPKSNYEKTRVSMKMRGIDRIKRGSQTDVHPAESTISQDDKRGRVAESKKVIDQVSKSVNNELLPPRHIKRLPNAISVKDISASRANLQGPSSKNVRGSQVYN